MNLIIKNALKYNVLLGLSECIHIPGHILMQKNTHAQILIVSRINISIVITSENGDGADHVVHNYCRKTMHVY